MNLTIPQAADLLGRSKATIRRYLAVGLLAKQQAGHRHSIRIPSESLERFKARTTSREMGDFIRKGE
ncbi:MAG: helix-turn-helix domain-containing protein [Verrucomicrobiota bacterium]